jgi:thiamine biosynthesis protein ThiS
MTSIPTNLIEIVLNGEKRQVPEGLSVAGLLAHLGITADRVAVELELEIVPRPKWDAAMVLPGAQVEVVHFVGGG